jgi:hypothetical protein
MFRVFFTNFGYFSQDGGATEEDARAIAKRAGFQSQITNPQGDIVATYCPLAGFRTRTADLRPFAKTG